MKLPIVVGVLVVGAFVAGVVYFSHGGGEETATPEQSAAVRPSTAGAASSVTATPDSVTPAAASPQPAAPASKAPSPPADPRLDALKVSADNGLIEFVRGSDGKVISEIDKDPASPSFHKPLREYVYSGDKIVGATTYRYVGGRVEISRTAVSYKPDGSVDQFEQSMRLN